MGEGTGTPKCLAMKPSGGGVEKTKRLFARFEESASRKAVWRDVPRELNDCCAALAVVTRFRRQLPYLHR